MATKISNPDMPIGISQDQSSLRGGDDEVDILRLLTLLALRKNLFVKVWLSCVIVSIAAAFLLPSYYSSETRILPPQEIQSMTSMLLGQFSTLSNLTNKNLGLKNPSDVYVSLLQSRTVADALIKRFNLLSVYDQKRLSDAREKLADHSQIVADKDGIIEVIVEDKSADRAADIANGYMEELYLLNQQLAITEASQRRLFFAKELKSAKDDLANAEVELKKTEETTGLIQLDSQAKAIIESVAVLEAQIAAKEVELQSMRAFATEQNPQYTRAKEELAALQGQLSKTRHAQDSGNIMIPTGKVPTAGLEYVRRLRDVKYYETMLEVIAKQFEVAKIDEAKAAPVIQIIDVALRADKRSRPKRLWIIALGLLAGLVFATIAVLARESFWQSMNDGDRRAKLALLRQSLWGAPADPHVH